MIEYMLMLALIALAQNHSMNTHMSFLCLRHDQTMVLVFPIGFDMEIHRPPGFVKSAEVMGQFHKINLAENDFFIGDDFFFASSYLGACDTLQN